MTDTVKIPRPKFVRRKGGPNGRVEHDERGNATWMRTRASDLNDEPGVPELSLIDDAQTRAVRAAGQGRAAMKERPPKAAASTRRKPA